jgi:hypothetical protein
MELKSKSFKIERIGLKPPLGKPSNKFDNVKTWTRGSFLFFYSTTLIATYWKKQIKMRGRSRVKELRTLFMSKKSQNPSSPPPSSPPKKIVHKYFKLWKILCKSYVVILLIFLVVVHWLEKTNPWWKVLILLLLLPHIERERELQCTPNIQLSFQYQHICCTWQM